MLLVKNNTPRDAFELPVGWQVLTCRPTLYLGLSYIGISHFVRSLVHSSEIQTGSMHDYMIHLGCVVAALIMAQVLEVMTRPVRRDAIVDNVRRDRAARICNLTLGFGGGAATVLNGGWQWSGHTVALTGIAFFTIAGEILYQTYGKKHPYKPAQDQTSATETAAHTANCTTETTAKPAGLCPAGSETTTRSGCMLTTGAGLGVAVRTSGGKS